MTPMPPHRLDRFHRMVDKALRDVAAMDILKMAFVIQEERVNELRTMESRTQGMLVPNGVKEIELLKNIAEAIAKIDLGAELRRAKGMLSGAPSPTVPSRKAG